MISIKHIIAPYGYKVTLDGKTLLDEIYLPSFISEDKVKYISLNPVEEIDETEDTEDTEETINE